MDFEKQAAERLLERGIEVRATAPLLLRILGKRTIALVVRQPCLGTLYRISLIYLAMGIGDERLADLDNENVHALFTKHGKALTEIAAQAILNGKWSGRLFGGILARWLFWKLNPVQLLTIANVLVSITGTEGFTTTIRLVRNMKMTQPNLSQTAGGS